MSGRFVVLRRVADGYAVATDTSYETEEQAGLNAMALAKKHEDQEFAIFERRFTYRTKTVVEVTAEGSREEERTALPDVPRRKA